MQCINSVTYSFLINDEVAGNIYPRRGIRQGDPLSPYVFIVCREVLSGLCRKAQDAGNLSGLRVARNLPRINHLLFVDDTMFFTKTDPQCCSTLLDILHRYETAAEQMINAAKSSITFSTKTSQEIRNRVKDQLGIEREGGVGKYLGLPKHFGRKKKIYLPPSSTGCTSDPLAGTIASSQQQGKQQCYIMFSHPYHPLPCRASSYLWDYVKKSSQNSPVFGGIPQMGKRKSAGKLGKHLHCLNNLEAWGSEIYNSSTKRYWGRLRGG